MKLLLLIFLLGCGQQEAVEKKRMHKSVGVDVEEQAGQAETEAETEAESIPQADSLPILGTLQISLSGIQAIDKETQVVDSEIFNKKLSEEGTGWIGALATGSIAASADPLAPLTAETDPQILTDLDGIIINYKRNNFLKDVTTNKSMPCSIVKIVSGEASCEESSVGVGEATKQEDGSIYYTDRSATGEVVLKRLSDPNRDCESGGVPAKCRSAIIGIPGHNVTSYRAIGGLNLASTQILFNDTNKTGLALNLYDSVQGVKVIASPDVLSATFLFPDGKYYLTMSGNGYEWGIHRYSTAAGLELYQAAMKTTEDGSRVSIIDDPSCMDFKSAYSTTALTLTLSDRGCLMQAYPTIKKIDLLKTVKLLTGVGDTILVAGIDASNVHKLMRYDISTETLVDLLTEDIEVNDLSADGNKFYFVGFNYKMLKSVVGHYDLDTGTVTYGASFVKLETITTIK